MIDVVLLPWKKIKQSGGGRPGEDNFTYERHDVLKTYSNTCMAQVILYYYPSRGSFFYTSAGVSSKDIDRNNGKWVWHWSIASVPCNIPYTTAIGAKRACDKELRDRGIRLLSPKLVVML